MNQHRQTGSGNDTAGILGTLFLAAVVILIVQAKLSPETLEKLFGGG